jgi:hypothetical protein
MRQFSSALLNVFKTVPFAFFLMHPAAHADYVLDFWETHHESPGVLNGAEELSFFSTSSNFDADGNLVTPTGLSNYSRFENNLSLAYGISPRLTAYGTLAWGRVNVDGSVRPGNSFGFTDQLVGLNFQIHSADNENTTYPPTGGFSLRSIDFQTQISWPLYNNANADANLTPHLGSQTLDLTAGAFATARITRTTTAQFLLSGGAGFTYRSSGFSDAIPWSIAVRYLSNPSDSRPSTPGFQASLAALGVLSLQTQLPAGIGTNNLQSFAGTGGSFASDVLNPSLTTIRAQAAYNLTYDFLTSLSLSHTIWGRSAPSGFSIALGLQKIFGATPPEKNRLKMSGEEYGKANQGFVEYAFSAKVLRVNDRLNLVKINKGRQDGVEVGEVFDIFTTKPDGSAGEPIARAKATAVKIDEAALTITEYFKQVWIEEGFIAKRPLQ